MEHASLTERFEARPAPAALRTQSATMIDHAPAGARLRGLARSMNGSPVVQRLQSVSHNIQRKGPGEKHLLQKKSAAPASANHTGLPDNLKSGLETLSGLSMDHVRVHRNSSRPAQLNAHAFAQGANIHLAPGQDRHLPHEAWHVVQQAQGRVRPTMQRKGGVAVNHDIGLEREADVMGARAEHQPVIDGRISDPVDGGYGSTETPLTLVNKHTAQLYRMYTEDEKISQGNELLLDGDRNLYAAPSKFAQANALPGVFHFTLGTRKTVYGWHLPKWLNHVDVSLKPDLDGIEDTVFGGQLTDGNGALLAAHTQHLVGDFAHANAGDRPHKSDANKQAYADRDDAMTGPLMPSDCGLAAEWVVGRAKRASDRFTAGAVQPGTMYLKQATGPAPAWDYHWAGVIMTDGADHVTMENAASKPTDGYSKRDLDKSWFFRMYGTAADQSFDAEYTGDMGAGGVSTDAPG